MYHGDIEQVATEQAQALERLVEAYERQIMSYESQAAAYEQQLEWYACQAEVDRRMLKRRRLEASVWRDKYRSANGELTNERRRSDKRNARIQQLIWDKSQLRKEKSKLYLLSCLAGRPKSQHTLEVVEGAIRAFTETSHRCHKAATNSSR